LAVALRDKEKNVKITFLRKRLSARPIAAKAMAAMMAATPAAAQKGVEANPSPAFTPAPAPSGPSSSELMAHFVATAIPTANFIGTASRLAIAYSHNSKIQKLAEELAKNQTAVANSLSAWVNVNGPVVTLRSPYTGKIGPGAAKLAAPNLLPSQVSNLQRLSAAQGSNFDSLFVSTGMEALVQLKTLYSDFILNGTDPGLHAIATRELPKVEQTISALEAL
jgi:predicted outer membrane protein